MKKAQHILLSFLLTPLMLSCCQAATGPSHISSKIHPISINEKGEILCRTRFSDNPMGARLQMPNTYGYCVITEDSIIEFEGYQLNTVDYTDHEEMQKQIDDRDSVLNTCIDWKNLSQVENEIVSQFKFSSCNIASFRVDTMIALSDLEKTKNIRLDHTKQKALGGAYSTSYHGKRILLKYDFGRVLILGNQYHFVTDEINFGAEFSYHYPWINPEDMQEKLSYEFGEITGVLFLD